MGTGDVSSAASLFSPVDVGPLRVASRLWMAPLTRGRASMPGHVPNDLNALSYAQRGHPARGAGRIIAEAACVSEEGRGYHATPGIHTPEQVRGWKRVTDAVHAQGGRIACQLWHVGRVSHTALQPGGGQPVGPTSVPSRSKTYVDASMERVPTSVPRALGADEIPGIVEQFAHAARCAKEAGFDAVAFGRAFISNPDLAHRFRHGLPLSPWDSATFSGGGAAGYTSYPSLAGGR